jgi:hypothetical protein
MISTSASDTISFIFASVNVLPSLLIMPPAGASGSFSTSTAIAMAWQLITSWSLQLYSHTGVQAAAVVVSDTTVAAINAVAAITAVATAAAAVFTAALRHGER